MNDVETLVWTGLILKKSEFKAVSDFFKEINFLKSGEVVDAKVICDNVNGEDGRTDVLLILKDAVIANPIVRLTVEGLMWTSDFFNNYANDYV